MLWHAIFFSTFWLFRRAFPDHRAHLRLYTVSTIRIFLIEKVWHEIMWLRCNSNPNARLLPFDRLVWQWTKSGQNHVSDRIQPRSIYLARVVDGELSSPVDWNSIVAAQGRQLISECILWERPCQSNRIPVLYFHNSPPSPSIVRLLLFFFEGFL
jgi:hypothetical protein